MERKGKCGVVWVFFKYWRQTCQRIKGSCLRAEGNSDSTVSKNQSSLGFSTEARVSIRTDLGLSHLSEGKGTPPCLPNSRKCTGLQMNENNVLHYELGICSVAYF